MEFDTIHFKVTDTIRERHRFSKCHVDRHKWATPEPLYVLCARFCDYLPEEPCFKWTNMQVLVWLSKIGFPQYRNTFYENMINGRTLLLVDASALCAMNVKDFDHIKIITKAIRDLYKVELVLFRRSISLPPRLPDTHFKLYRVCSGPTYQRIKRSQLWRRMHIIQEFPPHRNHWRTLHEYLQHKTINQKHRIGYAPRVNMYYVKPNLNPTPSDTSSITQSHAPCDCIPPCECSWHEEYYRDPWTLACLLGAEAEAVLGQLKDGDLIVTEETPRDRTTMCMENTENQLQKDHTCICKFPLDCFKKSGERTPKVLTVVRRWKKYIRSLDENCNC